jgi:nucleotide sugar dehydrogenase
METVRGTHPIPGEEASVGRRLAVVGGGHIGLPWGAVLANDLGIDVTCVDVDEERVETINGGDAPFSEPSLESLIEAGVEEGTLEATTDPTVVEDCRFVAFTVNAQRHRMETFLDTVAAYAGRLTDEHVVVLRTTLPVDVLRRAEAIVEEEASGSPTFTVLPERLAQGRAVEEIRSLPKIVGVRGREGREAIRPLVEPFDTTVRFTDPATAMFVKLVDNTYRDAVFAIANQIAYVADELGLDAHEAIELANAEYPRNDIPTPGPVGGKCLPKDPHFLMDETIVDQPSTPDLFATTRRTNATLTEYVATEILKKQPEQVTVLGTSYKRDSDDTYNAPPMEVVERLREQGVDVTCCDPHVDGHEDDVVAALQGADVVLLGMNHSAFDRIEPTINRHAPSDTAVYDAWGDVDREALDRAYDGLGVKPVEEEQVRDPRQQSLVQAAD